MRITILAAALTAALVASARRVDDRRPSLWGGAAGAEAAAELQAELDALAKEGLVLRDATLGSVDFPSERDGRRVFLCWIPNEPEIGYWHGPESVFSGREPL